MNLTLFMQQSIKIYESIFWLPRGSQLALGKGRSACTAIGLSIHSFPSEDADYNQFQLAGGRKVNSDEVLIVA